MPAGSTGKSDFVLAALFNTNQPHSDAEIEGYHEVRYRQIRSEGGVIEARIEPLQLCPGSYYLSAGILPNRPAESRFYEYRHMAIKFVVQRTGFPEPSIFYPIVDWSHAAAGREDDLITHAKQRSMAEPDQEKAEALSAEVFEDKMKRVMSLLELPQLLKDKLLAIETRLAAVEAGVPSPQEREAAIRATALLAAGWLAQSNLSNESPAPAEHGDIALTGPSVRDAEEKLAALEPNVYPIWKKLHENEEAYYVGDVEHSCSHWDRQIRPPVRRLRQPVRARAPLGYRLRHRRAPGLLGALSCEPHQRIGPAALAGSRRLPVCARLQRIPAVEGRDVPSCRLGHLARSRVVARGVAGGGATGPKTGGRVSRLAGIHTWLQALRSTR